MLVMGPWGRGMFMDAKCDEPTGIEEWTIPASYMCRFDGPKKQIGYGVKYKKKSGKPLDHYA